MGWMHVDAKQAARPPQTKGSALTVAEGIVQGQLGVARAVAIGCVVLRDAADWSAFLCGRGRNESKVPFCTAADDVINRYYL